MKVVEPAFRGVLSATAHPEGCAEQVRSWVRRTREQRPLQTPSRVLVIGASGGLGLAARIAASFGGSAQSVGVCLERPGLGERPGTAGWYRTVAFEEAAAGAGLLSRTVVGDAFSDEVKVRTADVIAGTVGQVDSVIYAVAASRRRHPRTGAILSSVLKTTGAPFREKAFDLRDREVRLHTVDVASPGEISQTVAVMGGEDWRWWMEALHSRRLLARGCTTVALSYVGPVRLHPAYRHGTIGAAKDHLEATAGDLDELLRAWCGGCARVTVMRALVTQSSLVLPMGALYTILLLRVAARLGVAEDVIDQGRRLVQIVSRPETAVQDAYGRWRLDDLELRDDVQAELWRRWEAVRTDTLGELGDLDRFDRDMRGVYGFDVAGVDYTASVDLVRTAPTVLTS